MRNSDSCRCWRCTFCPCKVRNKFLVNFWNRTILLCIMVFSKPGFSDWRPKTISMWYWCPRIYIFILRAKICKGIILDCWYLWPCAKIICIQKDTLNKIIQNLTQNIILAAFQVSILSLEAKCTVCKIMILEGEKWGIDKLGESV